MNATSTTRYLVVGAGGMLGHDLMAALRGRDVTPATRADFDVTDTDAVRRAVAGHDVVINASAFTAVDAAESHEDQAYAVNAVGPANLARAAAEHGAVLVQVSTDYVFDGSATAPYAELAPTHPESAYGRTKAAGERLALEHNPDGTLIIRTAWLYGASGGNFVKTMARLAGERETLTVVDDQIGQPTWSADLAQRIIDLLDTGTRSGIFHATNAGQTSWCGFARAIFGGLGLDPARVQPISSDQFVLPAPRPAWSVLGHDGWAPTGLPPMRPWEDALTAALDAGVASAPA
ncbi:dTDP-4-dehydrorhamnose reductase [Salinibacterium sp.]|uniref:dTDP-4-dehydrorhamnose reductase n=1 Tax=Salinibacterium sp. TaxID=1915057 RepID=UPI00286AA30F|nr:dTDP-4-dehydrorhamnose reductase [Salinibacterium sp.]